MQISFQEFKFEDESSPLFYRAETLEQDLLYQQWQYELSLIEGSIYRFQSLEGLSNRPFKLLLSLRPTVLEVKFAYFFHSYVVSSQEVMATARLKAEAYNGTINGKGPFDLWADTDTVTLSESVTVRVHNEPYTGEPYTWELNRLLKEKLRRERLAEEGVSLEEDYSRANLNIYRPLTENRLETLPDKIVFGFLEDTKTVEQMAIEVVDKLIEDSGFGFTSSHSLSSYTLDHLPSFSFDPNLRSALYNTMISTLTVKDFTNARLD